MITSNSHMNPVYGIEEITNVHKYIKSGSWLMEHEQTRLLESLIADYTKTKYAHMVPSATAGLLIASMVAGVYRDQPFAVSAYTQAATANGAILLGGIPNIVDVDPKSYTIDFEKIPETCKLVFISSINGRYPADVIYKIAKLKAKGVFIIEDSAQALGSFIGQHAIGTIGDLGVYSFGAPKIITTGQGGCIVTNSKTISDKIIAIKNFGREVTSGEIYNSLGLNFKFTDLQASFGIIQMKKLPEVVKVKKDIYSTYRTYLSDYVDFIDTDLSICTPTYPEILVNNPEKLHNKLKEHYIGTRRAYSSLSNQPYHSRWSTSTPVTDKLSSHALMLPAQADLTSTDIAYIAEKVKNAL
jgi:perosamine synthetase